mgnify:CR=1 FL=1
MRFLIWDLWGDYAHFRKYYTTSSPLTFAFPPRPTLAGIVGALLGLQKDEYPRILSGSEATYAVRIMEPIKKTRLAVNYINTKEAIDMSKIKTRSQVRLELVKNPCYRIYFSHMDYSIYQLALQMLGKGKTYYTLSLGLSELLAFYRFVGEEEGEKITSSSFVEIKSVLPLREDLEIEFESEKEYMKDTMPVLQNSERIVEKYNRIIFERQGKPIKAKVNSYWRVGDEQIVVL